ncbi:MAG: two-component system, OmpR family, alkaline phosphatase synthesis response regulator PhoP [Actinomycetota bacterium]|jgi:DNA-binding response OmpR family regulator|nr:two-component system, OmpR family, alkaline phosphatase synthesis response regulator PhoP [Actinomycetota bacterium]
MKTVLVVDDDDALRELILWKLTKGGYATLSAPDGAAGLVAATSAVTAGHAPDLILVDWMMPKMTGIELCQALRDNPLTCPIPIILLTANRQDAEVERGFEVGVDDYILKPFNPKELLGRVRAVLARAEARA